MIGEQQKKAAERECGRALADYSTYATVRYPSADCVYDKYSDGGYDSIKTMLPIELI